MLHFERLSVLDTHIMFLRKKFEKDVFLVGGGIRDIILGITQNPQDIDLTCAGDPDLIWKTLEKNFKKSEESIFRTEKFGTMTLVKKDGLSYECTPFRSETTYDDHRHPKDITWINDLIIDSERRDFTINALYYTHLTLKKSQGTAEITDQKDLVKVLDVQGRAQISQDLLIIQDRDIIASFLDQGVLHTSMIQQWCSDQHLTTTTGLGLIFDPQKGIQDLIKGKLQAVGNPDQRFQEDALRIIRALRFVNVLNTKHISQPLDFHKTTWKSLKKNYYQIQFIAKERIRDELLKVFKGSNPFGFIALCDEINILKYLFPSLYQTKNINQPVRYHPFDVYAHTMLVLWNAQQIHDDYLFKFGALYHDVGKTEQYSLYGVGLDEKELQVVHASWLNHTNCGVDMVKKDFAALGFSSKEIETIGFYVGYHMRPGEILNANDFNQPKKVRQLLSEYGYEKIDRLFDLCKADRLGQFNPIQGPMLDQVDALKDLLKHLEESEGQFTIKQLAVDGTILMKKLKLEPGPLLKELLDKALEWAMNDIATRNTEEVLLHHLKSYIELKAKTKKTKK